MEQVIFMKKNNHISVMLKGLFLMLDLFVI